MIRQIGANLAIDVDVFSSFHGVWKDKDLVENADVPNKT